ncbi:MAG TPA: acyl-CoA dehydrogenase family protein, partial [Micromonospora sp.]
MTVTMTDDDYRANLRAALAQVDADTVAGWERDGHLPRQVITDLADRDVFRDRWELGAEKGLPRLVVMAEEAAGVCSGLALAVMGQSEVFIGGLRWLGSTDRHRRLLDDALAGRAVGCFGSTEPHGGSDLAGLRTTATRTVDGWHLVGHKRYISNLGGATHMLVVGRVAGSQPRDLTLFLLPLDTPGVRVHGFFGTAGLRSCDVGEASFDVHLPSDAVLGAEGMGIAYASRLLQFERLSICVQLLTAGRSALGLAAAYARRRVIGDAPLIDRQALRHRLAHARARLGVVDAALRDIVARGSAGQNFAHDVAALKLVANEVVEKVTDDCLQVLGARGYTSNYPAERWWRDVRLARIGGGADEVLTEVVASRLTMPDARFDTELDRL